MPKPNKTSKDEASAGLKPFLFHGMDLTERNGQGWGDCLFCGKPKFAANPDNGLWDCKVCGMKGNPLEFIRALHEMSEKATSEDQYSKLMDNRGLLTPEPLYEFGVCHSILRNEWLVPGYLKDRRLGNLYGWRGIGSGKRRLMSTPEMNHQLMGLGGWDPNKPNVYICEGPWDAMALWEVMRSTKWQEGEGGKLSFTGNPTVSLWASANVIATPGCNVWHEGWGSLFAGKRLFFLYDNDHPATNPQTKTVQPPGAWAGMRRAVEILATAEDPPSSVAVIHWGKHSADHCKDMTPGFDVRDWLTANGTVDTLQGRVPRLGQLLDMLKLVPEDWVKGRGKGARKSGGLELQPLACTSWRTLLASWRKSMKWTPGLNRALCFMLACSMSTDLPEEQLWGKVVGPPSCGKSTLCEALSVCKKHVVAKSTMRGFHSGYKSDKEGTDDNSLLSLLRGKTLITKDGDTLLQSPNLGQILSEARDIYDRVSRTHYRHGMNRDYENFNMTWLLCGTSSLRTLDASELGQRFIDCVIMDSIDPEHELDINRRKAAQHRASYAKLETMNGSAATYEAETMVQSKRLTGGYLEYLRKNANGLTASVARNLTDAHVDSCIAYGTFVAIMRARPSKKQNEEQSRELSTRLVSQFMKLLYCITAVMGKEKADNESLEMVRQIAMDTARGVTLNILQALVNEPKGMEVRGVAVIANETEDIARSLLRFLGKIGAVELQAGKRIPGVRTAPRWKASPMMTRLLQQMDLTAGQGNVAEATRVMSAVLLPGIHTATAEEVTEDDL